MKKNPLKSTLLGAAIVAMACVQAVRAKVVIYPPPPGMPSAADRTVQVDGQNLFVYEAPVNHNRIYNIKTVTELTPMAYFDFSGSATVSVTANDLAVTSAVVRPTSLGIVPQIAGNKITFTVAKPAHLTVEFNGQYKRALHLFADSLEANPRTGGDGTTRFFGPGVHTVGEMVVGSGQTIYIAGGAVVYGAIRGIGVGNFKLAGRGILHGGKFPREGEGPKNLIYLADGCNNINLGGVTLLDSPTWNVALRKSRDIRVDDLKIIGARANSDGIDIVSCENVFVNRAFVRAWDDCLCVKSDGPNTRMVQFTNSVLWTDLAQSMEVGYETRSERISDILFKDIDVIHAFHKPVVSIHAGSQALIENVRFENIRVDDAQMGQGDGQNLLIDLWIGTSVWTANDPRGRINGVTIKNVNVLAGRSPVSRIWGFGAANKVENVAVEDLTILGRRVCSRDDGQFAFNTHVANVTFPCSPISGAVGPMGAARKAEIKVDGKGAVHFRPGRAGAYVLRVTDARGRLMGTYRGKVREDGTIRTSRLPAGRYVLSGDVAGEAFSGTVNAAAAD